MTSIEATPLILSSTKIHFIGIGGIGISALARMFLLEGKRVSGSDRCESPIVNELKNLGVLVKIGHEASNIPADCDLVIYTIAIEPDNPELLEAKRLTIKTMSYPEALGELTKQKKTIAVSGTHGKTTTTAMIAKIFVDAGLDPTVVVGSLTQVKLPNGNCVASNFIAGKGEYLIVEACEYRRSFLNLHPQILVITNIDNDHLDYYKDLEDIKSAFEEMKARVPADGKIITEQEYEQLPATSLQLAVPGKHNVRNAQAAWAVARAVGISDEIVIKALNSFTGTWRRFEFKGETKESALVYDDYAHHPTEIKATLAGAREKFPDKKIIAIFQPHLYSRTKLLLDDFATAFKDADEVILLPIYAAREAFDSSISSEILARAITAAGVPAAALPDFPAVQNYLSHPQTSSSTPSLNSGPNSLIITIGAGNIFELASTLVIINP